jgi:hypothetical protein
MAKLPKLPIPKYDVILPSTGKKIAVRPYLAKEQIILLMAQESNDRSDIISAIKQVVNNCILDDSVDIDSLPSFDVEYLFLKLRGISVNQQIELTFSCTKEIKGKKCTGTFDHVIQIENLDVDKKVKKGDNVIKLVDDFSMIMKYPTFDILESNAKFFQGLLESEEEQSKKDRLFGTSFNIIYDCTESIVKGNEIYDVHNDYTKEEFGEFLEGMTDEVFEKVLGFFDSMPKLNYVIEFKCPKCGAEESIVLNSLPDFFG